MDNKSTDLNPYYVSGFVDGEGCFTVLFTQNLKFQWKIEVRPNFSISQGKSSQGLMRELSVFFGSINENIRPDENTLKYESRSLEHLINRVIPHFDTYPLQSNKQKDFLKFKEMCGLMKEKKHLSKTGLKKIVEIAYTMNLDNSSQTRRKKPKEYWLSLLEDSN